MKTCKRCGCTDFNKWGKCKECVSTKNRLWRERNKDYHAKWKENNPNYRKEYYEKNKVSMYKAHRIWVIHNIKKVRLYRKKWDLNNKEIRRIHSQNRRARIIKNNGKLSKHILKKLFVLQKGKCAFCKKGLGNDINLDHIMPLALGGNHEDSNIQLLHSSCNYKKGKFDPIKFMQKNGFLI